MKPRTTTSNTRMNSSSICSFLLILSSVMFGSTATFVRGFHFGATANTARRRWETIAASVSRSSSSSSISTSSSSSSSAAARTRTRTTSSPLGASNANELMPLKRGSTVALVTPFEPESGNVDFAGLRQLLQYHVEAGTDNLCILGTTGEAGVLSMAEREQVLQVAVEQVKGKLPIMVGCGTINPASVKAMVQQAVDCGCDAALIVTPYYVKPPQRCLVKHFLDAATYGLPVVVYNVPSRTAVDMTDESIALCASLHENIVAVKDATGKLARVAALREQLAVVAAANAAGALPNKDFLLYSGDDATSMDFVLQGGDGCISVTANVAANAMHRVMASALRGDGPSAAALNDPLRLLHEKLFCEANPIPVKYAVSRMMGGSDGSMKNNKVLSAYCRPPLDYLDASYESAVESALRQAGLLAEE